MTAAVKVKEQRKSRERKRKCQTGTGFPKYILTQRTLCACYMRCFREYHVKVRREFISKWQSGINLGNGNLPWHPLPDEDGRYLWSECKPWFETVILPKYKFRKESAEINQNANTIADAPIEELEYIDKRKEFDHREWERAKERGEFISRASALATGIAAVRKIHSLVADEDERQLPAQRRDKLSDILKSENISTELITKICDEFMAWDIELGRSLTDRRETAAAEAAQFKNESEDE